MAKHKKSGSAIFMYCVIALAVAVSTVCFALYYTDTAKSSVVLWAGVTFFTVMYHFWVRIIMGNVTRLFRIDPTHWWFKAHGFEKRLYRLLRVKNWKDKALTYEPYMFSLKERTLSEILTTMCKSEVDHWINELISVSTLLFSLLWGQLWIFLLTAVLAMAFDAQFIIIQRYNRPRILNVIKREQRKTAKA